jgi:hypothetical protein
MALPITMRPEFIVEIGIMIRLRVSVTTISDPDRMVVGGFHDVVAGQHIFGVLWVEGCE